MKMPDKMTDRNNVSEKCITEIQELKYILRLSLRVFS